jgi:hypothetical protein
MGKKVAQADGTFCYTENCRIHDRPENRLGRFAAINDAERRSQFLVSSSIIDVVKESADGLGLHGDSRATSLAEKAKALRKPGKLDPQKTMDDLMADLKESMDAWRASDPELWSKIPEASIVTKRQATISNKPFQPFTETYSFGAIARPTIKKFAYENNLPFKEDKGFLQSYFTFTVSTPSQEAALKKLSDWVEDVRRRDAQRNQ